jgi:hypothetical protein
MCRYGDVLEQIYFRKERVQIRSKMRILGMKEIAEEEKKRLRRH